MKTAQLYAIKNRTGQTLATYRALNAKGAIRRFMDDQAIYASQFRNTSVIRSNEVTAELKGDSNV